MRVCDAPCLDVLGSLMARARLLAVVALGACGGAEGVTRSPPVWVMIRRTGGLTDKQEVQVFVLSDSALGTKQQAMLAFTCWGADASQHRVEIRGAMLHRGGSGQANTPVRFDRSAATGFDWYINGQGTAARAQNDSLLVARLASADGVWVEMPLVRNERGQFHFTVGRLTDVRDSLATAPCRWRV